MQAKLFKKAHKGKDKVLTTIVDFAARSAHISFDDNKPIGKFILVSFAEDKTEYFLEIPIDKVDEFIQDLKSSKEWLEKN